MSKRADKGRSWHGSRINQYGVVCFVVGISLVAVLLFCFSGKKNQSSELEFELPRHILNNVNPDLESHPTVEIQNGTQLIWKIPNSPKAVLFIAHGCHRKASDFWDKSSDCTECTGLPEERFLVRFALAKKFAVLTVSSDGKCWSLGKEHTIVGNIIKSWVDKHKLQRLPLVALGASSGGYFVSALATHLRFSSIVLMIAEGVFDQISISKQYPPTLFVHMPKDVYRQQKIREFLEGLRMEGIDAAEIECLDLPLSPDFLAGRIPGLGADVSAKLFKLFQDKGFVDEKGYMKRDGRRTPWKQALSGYGISLEQSLITPVEEELNLAYAYHEMTSLHSDQIFNCFQVLFLCCESMPVFKNLKWLHIKSDKERGWEAMPVLLRNCPHLETLVIEGLLHQATDKCGEGQRSFTHIVSSKDVRDSRVSRNIERDDNDKAFLGIFPMLEEDGDLY